MKKLVALLVAMVFGFNSIFGFAAPMGMSMSNVLIGGGLSSTLPLPVAKGLEVVDGKMVFAWDKDEEVVGKDEFLKAFFTALQLKDRHFWVDMGMLKSVYEVLDPALVGTVIGRVFMESDIELKKRAMEMLSDVEIEGEDLGMFRLWIVPDKAEVLERRDGMGVEIKDLRLKVKAEIVRGMGDEIRGYIEGEMVKKLTKEVNEGKEFELLRKVFGAIVLARWYKESAKEGWPYYEVAGRDVMNGSLKEDNWSVGEYLREYGRMVIGTVERNDVPFVGGGINFGEVPVKKVGDVSDIQGPKDMLGGGTRLEEDGRGIFERIRRWIGKKWLPLLLGMSILGGPINGYTGQQIRYTPSIQRGVEQQVKVVPVSTAGNSISKQSENVVVKKLLEKVDDLERQYGQVSKRDYEELFRLFKVYRGDLDKFLRDDHVKEIQRRAELTAEKLLPILEEIAKQPSPEKYYFDVKSESGLLNNIDFIAYLLRALPPDSKVSKSLADVLEKVVDPSWVWCGSLFLSSKPLPTDVNIVPINMYKQIFLSEVLFRYIVYGELYWKDFFQKVVSQGVEEAIKYSMGERGVYTLSMLIMLSSLDVLQYVHEFYRFSPEFEVRARDVIGKFMRPILRLGMVEVPKVVKLVEDYMVSYDLNKKRALEYMLYDIQVSPYGNNSFYISAYNLIRFGYAFLPMTQIDGIFADILANASAIVGTNYAHMDSKMIEMVKKGKILDEDWAEKEKQEDISGRVNLARMPLKYTPEFFDRQHGFSAEDILSFFLIDRYLVKKFPDNKNLRGWARELIMELTRYVPVIFELEHRNWFSDFKEIGDEGGEFSRWLKRRVLRVIESFTNNLSEWSEETSPALAFLSVVSKDGLSNGVLAEHLEKFDKGVLLSYRFFPFWMAVTLKGELVYWLDRLDISVDDFVGFFTKEVSSLPKREMISFSGGNWEMVIGREFFYGLMKDPSSRAKEIMRKLSDTQLGKSDPVLVRLAKGGSIPPEVFKNRFWNKMFNYFKSKIIRKKDMRVWLPVLNSEKRNAVNQLEKMGFKYRGEKEGHVYVYVKAMGKIKLIVNLTVHSPDKTSPTWDLVYAAWPDSFYTWIEFLGLSKELPFDVLNQIMWTDSNFLFRLGTSAQIIKGGEKSVLRWLVTGANSWFPMVGAKDWGEVVKAMTLFFEQMEKSKDVVEFLKNLRRELDKNGLSHISVANEGESRFLFSPLEFEQIKDSSSQNQPQGKGGKDERLSNLGKKNIEYEEVSLNGGALQDLTRLQQERGVPSQRMQGKSGRFQYITKEDIRKDVGLPSIIDLEKMDKGPGYCPIGLGKDLLRDSTQLQQEEEMLSLQTQEMVGRFQYVTKEDIRKDVGLPSIIDLEKMDKGPGYCPIGLGKDLMRLWKGGEQKRLRGKKLQKEDENGSGLNGGKGKFGMSKMLSNLLIIAPVLVSFALLPSISFAGSIGDVVGNGTGMWIMIGMTCVLGGGGYWLGNSRKDKGDGLEMIELPDLELSKLFDVSVDYGLLEQEEVDRILNEIEEVHRDDPAAQMWAKVYWICKHQQFMPVLDVLGFEGKKRKNIERKMKKIAGLYEEKYVKEGRGISLKGKNVIGSNIKPGGIDLRTVVLTPVNYGGVGIGV